MCQIFFLTIMKQQISLWIRCCNFTYPLWQFLIRRGSYFLINAVFIALYCGQKWIKIVFYWIAALVAFTDQRYKSAGDNYWSRMSSTNLRCSLQIWWCQLMIRIKKFKCSKQTQKRSQAQIFFSHSSWYNDLTFYEKKISHFTIPLNIVPAAVRLSVRQSVSLSVTGICNPFLKGSVHGISIISGWIK